MDRREIIDALTALAAELHRQGVNGEMYIVGDSAIALAFDERRDIDGIPRGRRSSGHPEIYGDRLEPAARFFVEQVFDTE